jgi:transcriptional regulator with XRE-family HTH domain
MDLRTIGSEIRARRLQTGLQQDHLAKLVGLSRVTVNQLENGTIKDLSYSRLSGILAVLGLDLATREAQGINNGLSLAARNASTSYRDELTANQLLEILRSGNAPQRYHPHLMTLLDETPLPIVVRAVSEAADDTHPPKLIMKNLQRWAREWKVNRQVW